MVKIKLNRGYVICYFNNMYIAYTTLVILSIPSAFAREVWVDPHDMNPSNPFNTNSLISCNQECNCQELEINFSISHYRRLLNLILTSLTQEETSYVGQLYVNLNYNNYKLLKAFADDHSYREDASVLRQIDQILSKALVRPSLQRLGDVLTMWSDRIYYTFYSRTTMVYLCCLFVTLVTYKLLRVNFTIGSVVKYLLFLGWVTDFAFTWMNMLQEAEINRMADSVAYESMPPYCNPSKMTWWQYIVSSMGSNSDCRKYHQIRLKDTFWSIAPVAVLSHQFGILVYTPASLLGQALGTFTSGLLGSLPWGVNIILLPILLIFCAIIACISFSFLSQTSFRVNFFHILHLEFGNDQWRQVGNILSAQNLNSVLHINHRIMVEDLPIERSKTETSNSSELVRQETPNVQLIKNKENIKEYIEIMESEATSSNAFGHDADIKECNDNCDNSSKNCKLEKQENETNAGLGHDTSGSGDH